MTIPRTGKAYSPPADFYVLTGGPGAGKTTLLQALAAAGITTVPEVARAIIRSETAAGGTALPWKDKAAYARRMLEQSRQDYDALTSRSIAGPVCFDRGLVDTLCYMRLCGMPIDARTEQAAARYRYHPTVFLLPYWDAIYHTDAERKQSPEEAEHTTALMRDTYVRYGYCPVVVPRADAAQRAAFVQAYIDSGPGRP